MTLTSSIRFARFAVRTTLIAAPLFGVAPEARANGRFPATNQLAIDPLDPSHLVLGVTFGVLESRDGGSRFSWTCERALGLADQEDPVIVLSDVGTTVLATFSGVVTSHDGCSYEHDPELRGEMIADLTRSAAVPGQLLGFRTVGLPESRFDSELIRSDDGGDSWTRLEPPLPEDVLPLTLEVAATDPDRIYLTARLNRAAGYGSVLLRSDDGGKTFERFPIPGSENQRLAFIAAVHPTDPDRVYIRIDDVSTVLLASFDAGESFDPWFTGNGRLLGFAVSPDGETLAFGGPSDGVWTANASTDEPEHRSDIAPTCLRFAEDVLYACSEVATSGFVLGKSYDLGRTFEPALRFQDLCGSNACAVDTSVAEQCATEWALMAPRLGARCGAGGSRNSGGANGGAGGAAEPRASSGDSGGCSLGAGRGSKTAGWGLALAALAWCAQRVSRRRPAPRSP